MEDNEQESKNPAEAVREHILSLLRSQLPNASPEEIEELAKKVCAEEYFESFGLIRRLKKFIFFLRNLF